LLITTPFDKWGGAMREIGSVIVLVEVVDIVVFVFVVVTAAAAIVKFFCFYISFVIVSFVIIFF